MADEKDANTQGQPEGEGEVSFSDAWKEAAAEEKSVSEDHLDPLAEPSKPDEGKGQEPETPPAGTAGGTTRPSAQPATADRSRPDRYEDRTSPGSRTRWRVTDPRS